MFIFQRLAEIAHSLLKVSPYDPESMGCRGLQQYMMQVLPAADWADDALKPALIMILRRLDKVFMKIAKKPSIRVSSQPNYMHQSILNIVSTVGFNSTTLLIATDELKVSELLFFFIHNN